MSLDQFEYQLFNENCSYYDIGLSHCNLVLMGKLHCGIDVAFELQVLNILHLGYLTL